MLLKIVLAVALVLALFLIYVSTRPSAFHYEYSGVIQSTPEKIFPYLSQFKLGKEWNTYERRDPNQSHVYSGVEGQVGSKMEFESKRAGSGNLEILKIVPNQSVEMRLNMTKPFAATNIVTYSLAPEGSGTRFTWGMTGDGGFVGKLMNVLIDCEKMMKTDFNEGIQNLKTLMESQK